MYRLAVPGTDSGVKKKALPRFLQPHSIAEEKRRQGREPEQYSPK
jgi:hypothetical protein